MADASVIGGATGIYLERMSVGLFLVYCLMLPMIWLTKFDTGVVFCRREDFQTIGGYNEELLLAEDVNFLFALKKLGWKTRRGLARVKGVKALGCTRKFDEHGDWHYFSLLFNVTAGVLRKGISFTEQGERFPEIVKYWYRPNR